MPREQPGTEIMPGSHLRLALGGVFVEHMAGEQLQVPLPPAFPGAVVGKAGNGQMDPHSFIAGSRFWEQPQGCFRSSPVVALM